METIASEEVTDICSLIFNDIHELENPTYTSNRRKTVLWGEMLKLLW